MADETGRQNLGRVGIIEMDPATGCSTLAASSASAGGLLIACPVDWPRFTSVMGTLRRRSLFDAIQSADAPSRGEDAASCDAHAAVGSPGAAGNGASTPLRDELLALPENARGEAARVHIGRMLAKTLGYPEGRTVPQDTGFFDLGLDSIWRWTWPAELSVAFAVNLRVAEVFNNSRVTALADHVARRSGGTGERRGEAGRPRPRRFPSALPRRSPDRRLCPRRRDSPLCPPQRDKRPRHLSHLRRPPSRSRSSVWLAASPAPTPSTNSGICCAKAATRGTGAG